MAHAGTKHRRQISAAESRALLLPDQHEIDLQEPPPAAEAEDSDELLGLKDPNNARAVLNETCCKELCVGDFVEGEVMTFRVRLLPLPLDRRGRRLHHARNASIQALARIVGKHGGRPPKRPLTIADDPRSRHICVEAYKLIMGIGGKQTWSRILDDARTGVPEAHEAHVEPLSRAACKTDCARRFLSWVKLLSQPAPPRGVQQHAASIVVGYKSWPDLYSNGYPLFFEQHKDEHEEDKPGFELFERVRRNQYRELRHDTESDLPDCAVCLNLKEWIAAQPGSVDANFAAKTLLELHEKLVTGERKVLEQLRAMARQAPSDWAVLQVDGSPFEELPVRTKNIEGAGLEYSIVGVHFEHEGYSRKVAYFCPHSAWKAKGCDFWLSAAFRELQLYFADCTVNNHPRARFLVEHLDNTTKDNKNRFSYRFAALLVAAGWFEDVILQFGLEYHGKGELDQMFGVVKALARAHRILSLPALQKVVEQRRDNMVVEELPFVLDTHAMAAGTEFPSGSQDLHCLHLYTNHTVADPCQRNVLLRGRKFLAKAADEPANTLPWLGTETGEPWVAFPAGTALPPFVLSEFREEVVQEVVREVRNTPTPFVQAADQLWWYGMCTRYRRQHLFTWDAPRDIPYTATSATASDVQEVINTLNFKLRQIDAIIGLNTRHIYSSLAAKTELVQMPDAEQRRRRVGVYARQSAALGNIGVAEVQDEDSGTPFVQHQPKRPRRSVIVQDDDEEADEDPRDESFSPTHTR